jgi:hypothetical protein
MPRRPGAPSLHPLEDLFVQVIKRLNGEGTTSVPVRHPESNVAYGGWTIRSRDGWMEKRVQRMASIE